MGQVFFYFTTTICAYQVTIYIDHPAASARNLAHNDAGTLRIMANFLPWITHNIGQSYIRVLIPLYCQAMIGYHYASLLLAVRAYRLPGIVGLNGTVFFVPKSLLLRELYLETSTIGIQDFLSPVSRLLFCEIKCKVTTMWKLWQLNRKYYSERIRLFCLQLILFSVVSVRSSGNGEFHTLQEEHSVLIGL